MPWRNSVLTVLNRIKGQTVLYYSLTNEVTIFDKNNKKLAANVASSSLVVSFFLFVIYYLLFSPALQLAVIYLSIYLSYINIHVTLTDPEKMCYSTFN